MLNTNSHSIKFLSFILSSVQLLKTLTKLIENQALKQSKIADKIVGQTNQISPLPPRPTTISLGSVVLLLILMVAKVNINFLQGREGEGEGEGEGVYWMDVRVFSF